MYHLHKCAFSSNKQNEYDITRDYDAFCSYQALFEKAENFSVFSRRDIAGGTENNSVTDIVCCAKNGKKIYLSIDGGFPVPELAYTEMHTEDCSEEMIREILDAVERYFGIKISHHLCDSASKGEYILLLYEA